MLQDQLTQAERERDIALKIQHETQERGKALLASLHSFGQAFDQALAEDQTVGGDELVEVRVNARLAKEALAHFQEVNLAEAERILAGEVLPIHDKDPPPPGDCVPDVAQFLRHVRRWRTRVVLCSPRTGPC